MNNGDDSTLRIQVACDWDSECSVVATLRSGAFGGSARAWLHVDDVTEFASSVAQLASTSAGEAALRGGYADRYTVNVRLRPQGNRGYILITGELASDPPSMQGPDSVPHHMAGGIIVEPAALEQFGRALAKAVPGGSLEAEVHGTSAV